MAIKFNASFRYMVGCWSDYVKGEGVKVWK